MTNPRINLPLSRRALLASGSAALLLAGCGSIIGPSNPPMKLYVLQPDLQPLTDAPTVSSQLAIAAPDAPESLDTERIALYRGETMDYFADAQWTDSAPRVLQLLLTEAFERSGKIAAVAGTTEGLRADYTLETELRDFEAHYTSENGAPMIVVDIVARVLEAQHRDVAGTLNSHHEVPAAQNDVASIVAAFDKATSAALEEIATWTLHTIPSMQTAAPPAAPPPPRRRHRKIAS
jgi:cholesterol transport system auxiliary component